MSITNVPELFGSMVFNDTVMKERLPKDVYKKLKKTMREGTAIDADVAAVVATAMKDWAVSKGATHYTHWFQPMTGITAEKHDSFITPTDDGQRDDGVLRQGADQGRTGRILLPVRRSARNLRGTRLHRMGPDQLRICQGWYPLHSDRVLLLHRSRSSIKKRRCCARWTRISTQACRILKLFGKDVKRVTTTVGPEQEYFLIDQRGLRKAQGPDLYRPHPVRCNAAEGSGNG